MNESPHKSKPGLIRIRNAFFYSVDGLVAAYRCESAFRQELLLAAIVVVIALALPLTLMQLALVWLGVLIVLITELLNSAVEATVDRISFDDHDLAKRAKDIGSAAVFLSLLNCLVLWVFVVLDAFIFI